MKIIDKSKVLKENSGSYDLVSRFEEIMSEIADLVDEAYNITYASQDSMNAERSKSYWYATMLGNIGGDYSNGYSGSMFNMNDVLRDMENGGEEFDDEDYDLRPGFEESKQRSVKITEKSKVAKEEFNPEEFIGSGMRQQLIDEDGFVDDEGTLIYENDFLLLTITPYKNGLVNMEFDRLSENDDVYSTENGKPWKLIDALKFCHNFVRRYENDDYPEELIEVLEYNHIKAL